MGLRQEVELGALELEVGLLGIALVSTVGLRLELGVIRGFEDFDTRVCPGQWDCDLQ